MKQKKLETNLLMQIDEIPICYKKGAVFYGSDIIMKMDNNHLATVELIIEYKNSILTINKSHVYKLKQVTNISISKGYVGFVKYLLYHYGIKPEYGIVEGSKIEIYRNLIINLQRWLKYKNKDGMILQEKVPYMLNGDLSMTLTNLLYIK